MDLTTYAILSKKIKGLTGATPEQVQAAVDAYLTKNPVKPNEIASVEEVKTYLGL